MCFFILWIVLVKVYLLIPSSCSQFKRSTIHPPSGSPFFQRRHASIFLNKQYPNFMKISRSLLLGLFTFTSTVVGQNKIDNTKDTLDQWVETQQIISQAKSEWKLEKAILGDTEKLLAQELERLNRALEDLEATSTAADEERTELAAKKEKLAAAAAVVAKNIGELESRTKAIVKSFPEPLVEKIKPLIRRLPNDSTNTRLSLGERVQNIVGILSQADKFNGSITQTSESLDLGDGRVIEVRTLYWGLAGAFYVDASGDYAGVGVPGEDGWEWPQVEGSSVQIKALLDVYEGTGDIQFVEVPAAIK